MVWATRDDVALGEHAADSAVRTLLVFYCAACASFTRVHGSANLDDN